MAAERYTIKQGDYGQAIPAICKDSAGAAVDISEAIEVRFHLGAEGSAATGSVGHGIMRMHSDLLCRCATPPAVSAARGYFCAHYSTLQAVC